MRGKDHELEIGLLGGFSIAKHGVAINIGSRSAQALLAYLALTTGSRHRRERLTGLLWPDASEESARQNLRNALWTLRKAVGEEYFLADKISVGFNPEANYHLDADALSHDSDLESAVSSYGGELLPGFFEEWAVLERERLRAEYDRQIALLVERLLTESRLHDAQVWAERWIAQGQTPEPAYRALMSAHHSLGDQAGLSNAYRRCVKALEEELGVEPSPETEALYERLLKEAPLAGPAPRAGRQKPGNRALESDAIAYGARQGFGATSNAAQQAAPALPPFLVGGDEHRQPHPRVVGREPELLRLSAALDDTLAGLGRTVFVTGEAGRGKSSLLGEFARRAQAAHSELVVAVGHCNGFTGAGDPLLPFRDALEMLTGDVEPRMLAGTIDREHAQRLWRLLPRVVEATAHHGPELLDGFLRRAPLLSRARQSDPSGGLEGIVAGAATAHGGAGNNQAALFEAYTRVLRAVSQEAPVVLLVEDLHWADASSVALLFHLAKRLGGSRLLIVCSLRAEDLADDGNPVGPALQRLVAELERVQGATRIDLDAGASGRVFIDELLDGEPNRLGNEFRDRLAELTEGHPLFAVELLEEMKAEGGLVQDESGHWTAAPGLSWHALPARVEGVIRTRLERLDADLKEALQVASVEGATFTADVVARVLGVDSRQLARRLSNEGERVHQLVQGVEIARVGDKRLARFRFRHDLFQRFLYNGLSGLDLAMLHEEVGLALEELGDDVAPTIAVELAHHFANGGLADRAARYLLLAGRQAAALYAFEEAAVHLRRAVELLDAEPESLENERLRLDSLLLLGSALQAVHGYSVPEVAEAFERARSGAAALGATRDEFTAVWSLSLYHSQHADFDRAVALGDVLLALAEREGDERLLLQAHHAIWFARFCLGDFEAVLENARRGLAYYPRDGGEEPSLRTGGHDAGACAHAFAGRALWYLGQPSGALEECERGLQLATSLTSPDSLAHVYVQSAEIQVLCGDGERALELADRCVVVASANGLGFWAAWATIMRGFALVLLGQVEEGISVVLQGRSGYPGIGMAEELSLWSRLAEAHATLHQLDEAEKCLAKAFEVAERLTAEIWRAELHRLRGVIQASRHVDREEAQRSFERALDIAHRHGARSLELRAAASWYEAEIRCAAPADAAQAARARLAAVNETFERGHPTADLRRARDLLA